VYTDKSCPQRSLRSELCLGAGPPADYGVQHHHQTRLTVKQSRVHMKSPARIKMMQGQNHSWGQATIHLRMTYIGDKLPEARVQSPSRQDQRQGCSQPYLQHSLGKD